MSFDHDNHTRAQCFNMWGSLCMKCDPKYAGQPIYSFTFESVEFNPEVMEVLLGHAETPGVVINE